MSNPTVSDIADWRDVDLDSLSEDCRAIFVLLSRKLDGIVSELDIKNARLSKCEEENRDLRGRVEEMESRLDDVESQGRCKNVIISGGVLADLPDGNLTEFCIQLLRQRVQYNLPNTEVLSSYSIGKKPTGQSPDTRNLMLELRDSRTKSDIIHACRTTKPTNMYANEDLIPLRAKLLYLLRRAKHKANGNWLHVAPPMASFMLSSSPQMHLPGHREYSLSQWPGWSLFVIMSSTSPFPNWLGVSLAIDFAR